MAETECTNNAKHVTEIKHKTLFPYTVWPKISAEIVQKVTKVKHENLIPLYSMAEKIVQK